MSDTHHFKGTLNCGILQLPWVTGAAASTQYGGQFVFRLSDLPIYVDEGGHYEFVRVNKMTIEFLPRYNQATLPGAAEGQTGALQQYFGQTFITAFDEVPVIAGTNGRILASQTWVSQNDEDAGVNEMEAWRNTTLTPDYVRGIKSSKETELYKKHSITFTPVYYVAAYNLAGAETSFFQEALEYEVRKKRWMPTNITIQQQAGPPDVTNAVDGPTFYGPMYSFTQLASASPTNPTQVFDVKVRYSVSFKRYRGT